MFYEAMRHRESYETLLCKLQKTKQGKADALTGKLREAKFN